MTITNKWDGQLAQALGTTPPDNLTATPSRSTGTENQNDTLLFIHQHPSPNDPTQQHASSSTPPAPINHWDDVASLRRSNDDAIRWRPRFNDKTGEPGQWTAQQQRRERSLAAYKVYKCRKKERLAALEAKSRLFDEAIASVNESKQKLEDSQAQIEWLNAENAALRAALNEPHLQLAPIGRASFAQSDFLTDGEE